MMYHIHNEMPQPGSLRVHDSRNAGVDIRSQQHHMLYTNKPVEISFADCKHGQHLYVLPRRYRQFDRNLFGMFILSTMLRCKYLATHTIFTS